MPDLKHALDKALQASIENLFNNLIANLIAPVFTNRDDTPIIRFERGFRVALDAYDQASKVIEKLQP
jgi:hypothetical protein